VVGRNCGVSATKTVKWRGEGIIYKREKSRKEKSERVQYSAALICSYNRHSKHSMKVCLLNMFAHNQHEMVD
jgi:hypothetical protein